VRLKRRRLLRDVRMRRRENGRVILIPLFTSSHHSRHLFFFSPFLVFFLQTTFCWAVYDFFSAGSSLFKVGFQRRKFAFAARNTLRPSVGISSLAPPKMRCKSTKMRKIPFRHAPSPPGRGCRRNPPFSRPFFGCTLSQNGRFPPSEARPHTRSTHYAGPLKLRQSHPPASNIFI